MSEYKGPGATAETMDSADDGLLRTGPLVGLGLSVGDEVDLRVGDERGRFMLVGDEADGLIWLWKPVGHAG